MFHKADVVAKYQCYNLETMQSDPSFLEEATEHTLGVAPHMGLTQQQGHAISAGERAGGRPSGRVTAVD